MIDEAGRTAEHEQLMFDTIRRIAPDAVFARPVEERLFTLLADIGRDFLDLTDVPPPGNPTSLREREMENAQKAIAYIDKEEPDVVSASYITSREMDTAAMQAHLAKKASTIHVAGLSNDPTGVRGGSRPAHAFAFILAAAPNGVAVSNIWPTDDSEKLLKNEVKGQSDCGTVPEDTDGNRERTCFVTFEKTTSESTALVSGGFALLYQHYRIESGNGPGKLPAATVAGIVEKACDTARNPTGLQERSEPGIAGHQGGLLEEEDYGCGMLDLDAARRPGTGAQSGRMRSESPIDLGGQDMVFQDEWGLPHRVPLQGLAETRPGDTMEDTLAEWIEGGPWPSAVAPSLPVHAGWAQAGEAGTTESGRLRVTAFSTEASVRPAPFEAHGAEIRWQAGERMALHAGWMREPRTAAGVSLGGALGDASADTLLLGWSGAREAGGWTLSARAEAGFVAGRAAGGFARGPESVRTSSFSLRAERALPAATVSVSVSQPVRIEGGTLPLVVPHRLVEDGEGRLRTVARRAEGRLEPPGRETRIGIRVDGRAGWSAGAILVDEPGHRRDAGTEAVLLGGWRAAW